MFTDIWFKYSYELQMNLLTDIWFKYSYELHRYICSQIYGLCIPMNYK